MAARTVFCSYARGDAAAVHAIAGELDQLGQQAWIDQRLSGGQSWWNTILEQIRACDCFLFALSDRSLQSKACQAELGYAHRLGRTILPVAVGPVIDQLLPPFLAEIQRVEAGDTRMLARALLALPPTPPLPDPLPEPPPVPITYLNSLAAMLDRDELTPAEQRNLEGSLKQRLANPDERAAAVALLQRLRRHPSVTAFVVSEIDADLASIAPRPAAPPPEPPVREAPPARRPYVPPAPTPVTPARTGGGGRAGILVALILVVVLAAAGAAAWVVMSGSDDPGGTEGVDTTFDPAGGDGGGTGTTTATTGGRNTTTTTTTTTEPEPTGAGTQGSGGATSGESPVTTRP
jgi:hypothetical protein